MATVENLDLGKSYYFRVSAENAVGTGNYAELREAVIPSNAQSAYYLLPTNIMDIELIFDGIF